MRFDRRKGFDAARGAKVEANAPCTASAPLSIQGVQLQEKIEYRRWCVDLLVRLECDRIARFWGVP